MLDELKPAWTEPLVHERLLVCCVGRPSRLPIASVVIRHGIAVEYPPHAITLGRRRVSDHRSLPMTSIGVVEMDDCRTGQPISGGRVLVDHGEWRPRLTSRTNGAGAALRERHHACHLRDEKDREYQSDTPGGYRQRLALPNQALSPNPFREARASTFPGPVQFLKPAWALCPGLIEVSVSRSRRVPAAAPRGAAVKRRQSAPGGRRGPCAAGR